jgi:crotonobetainyl-CoA:carnitine CoA-transferase CaiB-like acyl-CoA transferase
MNFRGSAPPLAMFADNDARTENAASLHAILQSQFESHDLSEWRAIFKKFDIKWSPFPTLDDVVQDPQMRAAGAIVEMNYPDHGKLETITSPVFIAGSEKRTPEPAPEVGAHTRDTLRGLGYNDDAIDALFRRGIAADH